MMQFRRSRRRVGSAAISVSMRRPSAASGAATCVSARKGGVVVAPMLRLSMMMRVVITLGPSTATSSSAAVLFVFAMISASVIADAFEAGPALNMVGGGVEQVAAGARDLSQLFLQ